MNAPTAGQVVCIGDAMVDVLAVLPGPLALGSDTPASVTIAHGGSAANTAAWLAATGTRTTFVGRVGDDAFGGEFVRELRASGVRAEVGFDSERRTGVCIVLVGPDGERTMIPSSGANATLAVADVTAVPMRSNDRLHLSGYALFNPDSRPAARHALHRAVSAGCAISVDVSSADPLAGVGAETFLSWLPAPVLVLANVDEAEVLTGTRDPADAARRLGERFSVAVVKCGAAGSAVACEGGTVEVAGNQLPVLDSTGAGDAFAAGMLGALMSGQSLVEAARRGNEFGARAVTQLGARPMALS